jgi:nucleoid-associated protein YgaU
VRRTSHEPSGSHATTHVVDQGESLWVIAREALRADASNIEIARYVSRIWDSNAATIGTGDPDLILPGQKLRMPS